MRSPRYPSSDQSLTVRMRAEATIAKTSRAELRLKARPVVCKRGARRLDSRATARHLERMPAQHDQTYDPQEEPAPE